MFLILPFIIVGFVLQKSYINSILFFNSNGSLAINTTIDGSYVDSSGCWIQ